MMQNYIIPIIYTSTLYTKNKIDSEHKTDCSLWKNAGYATDSTCIYYCGIFIAYHLHQVYS